jgi:hypothetical protein
MLKMFTNGHKAPVHLQSLIEKALPQLTQTVLDEIFHHGILDVDLQDDMVISHPDFHTHAPKFLGMELYFQIPLAETQGPDVQVVGDLLHHPVTRNDLNGAISGMGRLSWFRRLNARGMDCLLVSRCEGPDSVLRHRVVLRLDTRDKISPAFIQTVEAAWMDLGPLRCALRCLRQGFSLFTLLKAEWMRLGTSVVPRSLGF